MAYPNKTYVCFDADNDMESFLEMTSWCDDERPAINIHNIHAINTLDDSASPGSSRRKLREHLAGTRVLIVLIGGKAESLYKYVRWEIEYAVEHKLPIIAANLNDTRRLDPQLCPSILKDQLALHISFGREIIDYALYEWPDTHASLVKKGESDDFFYKNHVYRNLGLCPGRCSNPPSRPPSGPDSR